MIPTVSVRGKRPHRGFWIHDENRLQKTSTLGTSPSQPFLIFDFSGKRFSSATNDHFSFFPRNSMFGDMLDVPLISAEFHELLMQENNLGVNCASARPHPHPPAQLRRSFFRRRF